MSTIVQRLREKQADMTEAIERLEASEFDTGARGQIRTELRDLYREAADEIDRLRVGKIAHEVGRWLLSAADALEASPPGTVNLWAMLTDHARGQDAEARG